MFFGLGADGTVGANKNTIKIIGEDRTSTSRATSSTTRRSRGRRPSRTCASGREPIRSTYLIQSASFIGCHQFAVPRASSTCWARRAGRHAAAQQPVRPGGGLGPPAARRAARRSSSKRLSVWRIDADAVAREAGLGGAHQHGPADVLLRHLRRAAAGPGDRADQGGDREDLRRQGRGGRPQELRGGGPHAGRLYEVRVPADGDRPAGAAADRRGRRAGVRAGGRRRRCWRGAATTLPVSAMPVDGTYPERHVALGEAQHLRRRCRAGTRSICIQCGNCGFVCPHGVIRAKVYDEEPARRARRRASGRRRSTRAAFPTRATRCRSTWRTAPAAALCVEVCPVKTRRTAAPRDQHGADAADPRAGAREHRLLRGAAGDRARPRGFLRRCAARSSWSRCSSSRAPAPAAAKRPT